jgi:hypothetical protein
VSAACAIPLPGGLETVVSPEDYERAKAFRWHTKRKRSAPGAIYVQRSIRVTRGRNGKSSSVSLHRFILDAKPGEFVDHIDGNPLNNRRENLRICTNRQNAENVVRSKNRKRGGFKGVSFNKNAGKWQGSICCGEVRPNGKRKMVYLGLFDDPADAARAYDLAAEKAFGAFASLNFPEEAEFRVALAESAERAAIADVLRGEP